MKGDFTRLTFRPEKHYNGIWMQQGRLQLDADWNELVDIQKYLHQSQVEDTLGGSGANKIGDNFKISINNGDLNIAPGRIYVGGLLCELEKNTTYNKQPDYPNPTTKLENNKFYLAYLDVWQRHITFIEDPEIREAALDVGITDTTTRSKTIWQVKLLEIKLSPECDDNALKTAVTEEEKNQIKAKRKNEINQQWQKFLENNQKNRNNYLNARYDAKLASTSQQIENQLYRVEIHTSGELTNEAKKPTFKWSRDNGIVVSPIKEISRNTINIVNPGRDDSEFFAPNQWVEVTDNERELKGIPGALARLIGGTSGARLVFDPATVVDGPINADTFPSKNNPKVRRWDNLTNMPQVIAGEEWINLEGGIQVKFEQTGKYQTGDYWLIPARANNKDIIEWPGSKQPALGIKHYYCPLAFVRNQETEPRIEDYRPTFPSLLNCFDKTGGTITGDVEIEGNLFVTGKKDEGKYIPGIVGIGTKTPLAKFHVQNSAIQGTGTISSSGVNVIVTNTAFPEELQVGDIITANNQSKIITAIDPENKSFTINEAFNTNLTGNNFTYSRPNIALFTNSQSQAQLIVTELGNIGIGIDKPLQKLHVNGAIRGSQVTVESGLIGSLENINLSLQTGNATQMTLFANGNIGIGVEEAKEKLHINGAIRGNQKGALRISTENGYVDVGPQDSTAVHFVTDLPRYNFDTGISIASGLIGSNENKDLSLQTGDTTQITVAHDTGNVGVGLFVPLEKLHINGAIRGNQKGALRISTGTGFVDVGSQDKDWSHFKTDRAGYHFDRGITVKTGLISSDKEINLSLQTAGVTQMTLLQKNGFVGIGTSNPQAKLDVAGALRISDGTQFVNIAPQEDNWLHFQTNLDGYYFDKDIRVESGSITSLGNQNLSLQTAGITQLTVSRATGNIGIGVDNPLEKLHINGAIRGNREGAIRINTGNGFVDVGPQNAYFSHFITDRPGYHFNQGVTIQTGLVSSGENSNLLLQTEGNTRVTILQGNGNVGIGTSTPQEKLEIQGNIRLNGDLYQSSLREFKENIVDIKASEVSTLLKVLNPVQYNYKSDPSKELHFGFIADEMPDILASRDKTAIKPLDVVALLTQAVKEQQATIGLLINALKNQQNQVVALNEKVRILEQRVNR